MRQFAVIGLGRFGSSVAKTLAQKGHQVLGIDRDEEKVRYIAEVVTQAVQLDATDEKALKAVGIDSVDVAIVGIAKSLEASILITLILKERGINEIVVKAMTESQGKVLKKVGASRVVFPEREMGARIANNLVSPKIIEHIDVSEDYSILETIPPKDFIGKSLKDIDVRAKYDVNVIAIKRRISTVSKNGQAAVAEKINFSPSAEDTVREGDTLVVIGSNEDIEKLKKRR